MLTKELNYSRQAQTTQPHFSRKDLRAEWKNSISNKMIKQTRNMMTNQER